MTIALLSANSATPLSTNYNLVHDRLYHFAFVYIRTASKDMTQAIQSLAHYLSIQGYRIRQGIRYVRVYQPPPEASAPFRQSQRCGSAATRP